MCRLPTGACLARLVTILFLHSYALVPPSFANLKFGSEKIHSEIQGPTRCRIALEFMAPLAVRDFPKGVCDIYDIEIEPF